MKNSINQKQIDITVMLKMNIKNALLVIILMLFSFVVISAKAQNSIRWMQQPAVSPDAKWIAFEYKGNVYKVAANGGKAIQLTHDVSYNGYPVWSHDGSKIAFASDRNGNFDVFIIGASGGAQQRLTYNSAKDIPYGFSEDNLNVYYGTSQHDVFSSVRYPEDRLFLKLFKVPATGGASLMVNSRGMEFAHFNTTQDRIIFQDSKGSPESSYRKHATSSITRDIWTFNTKTGVYNKVSPYIGEDREPVWGKGDDFYYLSERKGNQNIFRSSTTDTAKIEQLTFFERNPVRNLSIAKNGSLVFTQNGDLYSLLTGNKVRKIAVQVKEALKDSITTTTIKGGSSDFDVSPDGKQIAFVVRGDIYVSSTDSNSVTRRITNTPYIERMVNFSPDGKHLLYSVENGSSWDIDQVSLSGVAQQYFYNPGKLITTSIIAGAEDEFQGVYSPDGKQIAFLENRETLKAYDMENKSVKILLPHGINFSTNDGDQSFSWSPDSKYVLVQHFNNDILLIAIENPAKRINLTKSAFENRNPFWGKDSNTMYSISSKNGLTNFTHTENLYDIQQTYFSKKLWDQDRLASGDKTSGDQNISAKGLDLFADTIYHSKILTASPANIKDFAVSADGKFIYMLASYEQDYNLYKLDVATKSIQLLAKLNTENPRMKLTKNGKAIALLSGGNQFQMFDIATARLSPIHINTKADVNITLEQMSTYDHVYNLERNKFMDPNLNGVDFKYFYDNYRQFLGNINNGYDFELLLAELVGELNNSHLITRWIPSIPKSTNTASLGLIYDLSDLNNGLQVKEIISGGPFDHENSKMQKGFIIDQIDGQKVSLKEDWAIYLNNKTDSTLRITFYDPATKHQYEERVKAIPAGQENMEQRWVKQMEHLTDSLSGGKIGYVYISQMGEDSFRLFYDKVLGKFGDKKALIVDTRFNGGGDLLVLLTSFLSGKLFLTEKRQGTPTPFNEPGTRWTKPSAIVMSEANYSDAFRVPFVYKNLGIGKLVGMPVPGTGTATGRDEQLTPGIAILVPQGGTYAPGEDHPTENHQLNPDILVNNDYPQLLAGRDQQIEAAVKHLLTMIH